MLVCRTTKLLKIKKKMLIMKAIIIINMKSSIKENI